MDSPTKMQHSPISLLRKSVRSDMIPLHADILTRLWPMGRAHIGPKKSRPTCGQAALYLWMPRFAEEQKNSCE